MGSFDFEHSGCKQHYACFGCRKAFKAGDEFVSSPGGSRRRVVPCPECGDQMTAMGLLFRAPPKRAVKAWRGLAELAAKSPTPPFQTPRYREPEGACPKCRSRAGLVDGLCPYCGYSRRTAAGGRPAAKDYARGKRKRKK